MMKRRAYMFVVWWGMHEFGVVDRVPGVFHVQTIFWNVCFLPLVPLRCELEFHEAIGGPRVFPIPWCWKSVLLTWLRAGLFLFTAFQAFRAMVVYGDPGDRWTELAGEALIAIVLCALVTYWTPFRRASYMRARQLTEFVRLPEAGRIRLERAFGMMTDADASRALHDLQERARHAAAVEAE